VPRTRSAAIVPLKRFRVVPSTPPTESDCKISGPTRGSRYSVRSSADIASAVIRFACPSPEPFFGT
jgi:hypothetical protein